MAKVMVVEDEAFIMKFILSAFTAAGLEVAAFLDPRVALEQVEAIRPDLLVIDFLMPHVDGAAFVDALRGNAGLASTPVILLCHRPAETSAWEWQMEYVERMRVPYLAKPFPVNELVALAQRTLGHPTGGDHGSVSAGQPAADRGSRD